MFIDKELARTRIPALFVAHARARRVNPAPVLRRLDLCPDIDRDEIATLPVAVLRRLCDDLADAAGDPFFGLEVARNVPRGAFGLLEFLVRSAPNLATGLQLLVRHGRMLSNVLVFDAIEDSGRFALQLQVRSGPLCLGRQANEFLLGLLLGTARELTANRFSVRRVWLAHPRPADIAPLVEAYGTDRVVFGPSVVGFEADMAQFALPITSCDPPLYAFLHRMLVETADREGPIVQCETLRARIREHLPDGEPKIEDIAAELRVSVRSLQRKLAERGTSFRDEVDDVRREIACRLLDDDARTLGEVAMRLGYSDVRAFARAYKRWTGRSPGAARN